MTHPHTTEAARGVETNGEGNRTTAHLNLTKPLPNYERPISHIGTRNRFAPKRQIERAKRRYERQQAAKIPYAGAER